MGFGIGNPDSRLGVLERTCLFSVYLSADVVLADGGVVVPFNAEEFNVNSWLDISTNKGRLTPQVAGYYRLSASIGKLTSLGAGALWRVSLLKNTTGLKRYGQPLIGATSNPSSIGTWLVEANGVDDYFEIVVDGPAGAYTVDSQSSATYFQGELAGRKP